MLRRARCTASLTVVVLLCACSSGNAAPPSALGATPSPAATLGAAASSATASRVPPPPAVTATPDPTPIAVLAGDPWLLHDRYVADHQKGIFLVRPDGTDDHQILTGVPGDVRAPAWSADGSRIAFVYTGSGSAPDGEIWTAEADGSHAAKLLDGSPDCSGAFYPSWSPDGRRLAFVCYTSDGNGNLAMYDPATKSVTHLFSLAFPEAFDSALPWSPDGAAIAFEILHWDPTNTFLDGSLIATISSTGGAPTRLTKFSSFAASPAWSPDGRELVFNTFDQGNMVNTDHASNIYAIGRSGKGLRAITTASRDGTYRITQPRWDPSGTRIWVTIWQPPANIGIGWVDPASGTVTSLNVVGSTPQPRPVP